MPVSSSEIRCNLHSSVILPAASVLKRMIFNNAVEPCTLFDSGWPLSLLSGRPHIFSQFDAKGLSLSSSPPPVG